MTVRISIAAFSVLQGLDFQVQAGMASWNCIKSSTVTDGKSILGYF